MVDVDLLLTVTITLVVVPSISFIVGRFQSLPVDIVGAGASIIVLFGDSAQKFYASHSSTQLAPQYINIALLITLVGFVFTLIPIGIFKASQNERDNRKIKDGHFGTLYTELGYCLSLFFSILLLMYAISATIAVPLIFDNQYYVDGQLFEITKGFVDSYHPMTLFSVLGVMYLGFLFVRYCRLIIAPLKVVLDSVHIEPSKSP